MIAPHLPLTKSQYHKLVIAEKEEGPKLSEDATAQSESTTTEENVGEAGERTVDSSVT